MWCLLLMAFEIRLLSLSPLERVVETCHSHTQASRPVDRRNSPLLPESCSNYDKTTNLEVGPTLTRPWIYDCKAARNIEVCGS